MSRIVKKKVTDSVLKEIRRMITSGEIRKGDKLPNQNEFAAQLGVSRSSLREALHTLALFGVIEQRPGVGTVVRDQTQAFFTGDFDLPLISDAQGVKDLIEARRVIELDIVELAADRASDAELESLERVLEEMTRMVETGRVEDYGNTDIHFHDTIAQAAHNRFLLHLFTAIRQFLDQFIRESFILMPEVVGISQQGHHGIFDAMKNRDKKRAVEEMIKHIDLGQKAMAKLHQGERDSHRLGQRDGN